MEGIPKETGSGLPVFPPVNHTGSCLVLSAVTCDTCEGLSVRDAHLNLGVQGCCWESVTWPCGACVIALSCPDSIQSRNRQLP